MESARSQKFSTPLLARQSEAFTLVELMLAVAIMAALTGFLLPTFNNYTKNQNLKQAQEQLRSDLRNVQNKALNGAHSTTTITFGGTVYDIKYWGVRISNNASLGRYQLHYFISADTLASTCADSYAASPVRSISQGYYDFAEKIIPTSRLSNPCLFFSIRDGSVTAVNFLSLVEPIIYLSDGGSVSKTVVLNSAGLIF